MTEKPQLPTTKFDQDKVLFGEREFTNLCNSLIRLYRFRNHNQDPKAIVFPNVTEIGGTKVEWPEGTRAAKPEDTGS